MQVIADFEMAQRNAIRRVLPDCQLVGCWFHFNQSIVRYIRTHGMTEIVRNNYGVATVIRMITALPHLPPEMDPQLPIDFHITGGFFVIQQLARHMDIMRYVDDMLNYIQHYWIDTVGPVGCSVYGLNIRTNDYVESFHSMLKTTIGQHPPIWTFYDRLRSVRRSIITSRDRNNEVLQNALRLVRNGRYNTASFLRRVAHVVRGYLNNQIGPLSNVHREDEIQQLPPVPLEPLLPPPLLENNGRQIAQRRGRGGRDNRIIPQIPRRRGRPRGQVQPDVLVEPAVGEDIVIVIRPDSPNFEEPAIEEDEVIVVGPNEANFEDVTYEEGFHQPVEPIVQP
eukprot:XP_016663181.1 PREDICTED: uncharacterized protein LOC107884808 [Acyrthosiphon pisum]